MEKTIDKALKEYEAGERGLAPILWHKKPHKHGSGEFACVRGIYEGCNEVVDCDKCYSTKEGGYCLNDGQTNNGFLAVEYKHQKFVDQGRDGAYASIQDAIEDLF